MLSSLRHMDDYDLDEDMTEWRVPSWMDAYTASDEPWGASLSARNPRYDMSGSHRSHKFSEVFPADQEYSRTVPGAITDADGIVINYEAPVMKEILQVHHSKQVAANSLSNIITDGNNRDGDPEAVGKYIHDQQRVADKRVELLNKCIVSHDGDQGLKPEAPDFIPGVPVHDSTNHHKLNTSITYRRFAVGEDGESNAQEMQDSVSWMVNREYDSFFGLLSNDIKEQERVFLQLYNAVYKSCPRGENTKDVLGLTSLVNELEWDTEKDTKIRLEARNSQWGFSQSNTKPWFVWKSQGNSSTIGNHMVVVGPMELNVCHEYDNPLVNKTIQEMILWKGRHQIPQMKHGALYCPSVFWNIHIKIHYNNENHILSFSPCSGPDHCIVSHICVRQNNDHGDGFKGLLQLKRNTGEINYKTLFNEERDADSVWSGASDQSDSPMAAHLGVRNGETYGLARRRDRARGSDDEDSSSTASYHTSDSEDDQDSEDSQNRDEHAGHGQEAQYSHTHHRSSAALIPCMCIGAARGMRWGEGKLAMVHSKAHWELWYRDWKEGHMDNKIPSPGDQDFYVNEGGPEGEEGSESFPAARVARISFSNWGIMASSYLIDRENGEVVTIITGVLYPPHLIWNRREIKKIPRNPVIKSQSDADWDNQCKGDFFVRMVLSNASDVKDTRDTRVYFREDQTPLKQVMLRKCMDTIQMQVSKHFNVTWNEQLCFFQNVADDPHIFAGWNDYWSNIIRLDIMYELKYAKPIDGSDDFRFVLNPKCHWYAKHDTMFEEWLIKQFTWMGAGNTIPDIEKRISSYIRHYTNIRQARALNTGRGLEALEADKNTLSSKTDMPEIQIPPFNFVQRRGESNEDMNKRYMREQLEYMKKFLHVNEFYSKRESKQKKSKDSPWHKSRQVRASESARAHTAVVHHAVKDLPKTKSSGLKDDPTISESYMEHKDLWDALEARVRGR
jgi:hypothetical protein